MTDETPPPIAPGSPTGRLAARAIQYATLLHHESGRFLPAYRATRALFWGDLLAADELHFFGSDLAADLLAIAQHPAVAADVTAERAAALGAVQRLGALRRMQGGDVAGGLASVRALLGEPPAGKPVSTTLATSPAAPVLTVEALERLAAMLRAEEPGTSAVVLELAGLLGADPTYTVGPATVAVLHRTYGGTRFHPGYGTIVVQQLEAEVLDRLRRTPAPSAALASGLSPDFLAACDGAFRTASTTSRALGGPGLERGLQLHLDLRGVLDQASGRSAGLAHALLHLSEARSAWQRRRSAPHPGTAAIGCIEDDGRIGEVFTGSLAVKLRRLWESGVRRVYVPAAQVMAVEAALAELRGDGDGCGMDLVERRVEVIGIAALAELEATRDFVLVRRSLGEYMVRLLRRYRTLLALGSSAAMLGLVASMLVDARLGLETVERDGCRLTARYRWGRSKTVDLCKDLQRETLVAPPQFRQPMARDLDGDGNREVLVLSMQSESPVATQGLVRADLLDDQLRRRPGWPVFADPELRFADGSELERRMLTPERLLVEDCTGDGRAEIVLVSNHKRFPSCVSIWDLQGGVIGQFLNPGHIAQVVMVPSVDDPAAAPSGRGGGPPRRYDLVLFGECIEGRGSVLVRLPFPYGTSALPLRRADRRFAGYAEPAGAVAVEIPLGIGRVTGTEKQCFPGVLAVLHAAGGGFEVSTLEIQPTGTVLRGFDPLLHQTAAGPTTALRNLWAKHPEWPPIDGEPVREAVETLRRWEAGAWHDERLPAWSP